MDDFGSRAGGALVVGGSGGLGAAIAQALADRGARVGVTYRSTPVDWSPQWQLDLTDAGACRRVVEEATKELSGLHTLVYAAGPHVPMRHLSRTRPEEMTAQLAQDSAAFFNVLQPALAALRESQGSLVAITTAATSRHPARDGLSAAPKAAVEALVRGVAVEEGRYGVRANCVGPGMLSDGMAARLIGAGELDETALEAARANIPLHRFGTAADVAEAVCFLASDRAGFITGQKINVDGGYTA